MDRIIVRVVKSEDEKILRSCKCLSYTGRSLNVSVLSLASNACDTLRSSPSWALVVVHWGLIHALKRVRQPLWHSSIKTRSNRDKASLGPKLRVELSMLVAPDAEGGIVARYGLVTMFDLVSIEAGISFGGLELRC